MMPSHDAKHEELMEVLVTGSGDPTSPEFADLQTCPVCRERLQDLQSLTSLLHSAGREQRTILSEEMDMVPAPGADRMSEAVRAGLRERAQPPKRSAWPWLAFAAVLVVGVIIGFQLAGDSTGSGQQPSDRLLHVGEAWPVGSGIAQLTEKGFEWPGHPDETYELFLFEPSNPLIEWKAIPCQGNECPVEAAFEAEMRAVGMTWMWRYERTSPQQPGSRSVTESESFEFSFSQ